MKPRFSMKTLLGLVSVFASVLGLWCYIHERHLRARAVLESEDDTVHAILALFPPNGVTLVLPGVTYSGEFPNMIRFGKSPWDFGQSLGDDAYRRVYSVRFADNVSVDAINVLSNLKSLKNVSIVCQADRHGELPSQFADTCEAVERLKKSSPSV